VIDASVKSRHIYSILQERLGDLPVMRVNNWAKARVTASNLVPYEGMPAALNKSFGEDHLDVAQSLANLAALYASTDQLRSICPGGPPKSP
jgi:hypothetical protein